MILCFGFVQEEQENYGIDWEGPVGADVDTVKVPETTIPVGFSVSEIENIDPLASSDEYGIDLHLKVFHTANHLSNRHIQHCIHQILL